MPVAKLDNAPCCQHTKLNGRPCSAPARRHRKFCVFHEAAHAKRPDTQVRLIEDAMSLQFALFQVMRSLDDHSLDTRRAALKLYALQIAASNLKRLQQEIEYNPHNDPAREMSLLELLMENFQIPEEERQFARTELSAHFSGKAAPQGNDPNLPPSPRFNIQACIDPHPTERSIDRRTDRPTTVSRQPSTQDWFPFDALTGGHKKRAAAGSRGRLSQSYSKEAILPAQRSSEGRPSELR